MVTRTKWVDRKFTYDYSIGLFPCIIERLRGTPARLDDITLNLPPTILTKSASGTWSIQEHIGHLLALDPLHSGRLDDFRAGLETLRAADMTNRLTYDSKYNEQNLQDILQSFRTGRMEFVRKLEDADEVLAARSALHPRLKQPMRVIDMAFFAAEHDDHHIAIISELFRNPD